MNDLYKNLVLNKIAQAIGTAQSLRAVNHAGLQGQLKELLVRDLLQPLLPADLGVGTGVIVSARGQQSGQQDIVLYDKSILPPLLLEGRIGIFPVESVLLTIESKSTLTAEELRKAHFSAKVVGDLVIMPGKFEDNTDGSSGVGHSHIKPLSCLFAFDSDLTGTGKSELARYGELCGDEQPSLQMICIVGKGFWYRSPQGDWIGSPTQYPFSEVLQFLAITINSYKRIADSRFNPRLGLYFLENQELKKHRG